MWKYVLIFAVILGLALYIAREDERAAAQGAQNSQHASNGASVPKADTEHPQENIGNSEWHTPRWYGFFRWPNGTTTWAIILTLLAIAEQTKETSQAAKAARDSIPHQEAAARAASDNAAAVVNTERAWIITHIKKRVKIIDTIETDGENAGNPCRKPITYFSFVIANRGRTPAEILAVRGYPELTYEGKDGGFTDPPDYGRDVIYRQVRMLAPNERWNYTDADLNIWSVCSMSESTKKDIDTWQAHYIFKGVVIYRDTLQPSVIHESRFCYTYLAGLNDYVPSGPPEHTKYT